MAKKYAYKVIKGAKVVAEATTAKEAQAEARKVGGKALGPARATKKRVANPKAKSAPKRNPAAKKAPVERKPRKPAVKYV